MSDKLVQQIATIEKLLKKPDNKQCADCKRNSPSWASISIGVFMCIKCSGFHREIGTDYSKVKSVNLDLWPPGALNNFMHLTNKVANLYWEHTLPQMNFEKLRNDDNRLQEFIIDKYKRRRYVHPKWKAPMALVLEGKNTELEYAEEGTEIKEEEEDTKQKPFMKKRPVFNKAPQGNTQNSTTIQQSTNKNNECLINFAEVVDDGFKMVEETEPEVVHNPNQHGFHFINKKEVVKAGGENLLDLNSYETMKDKQLQQLTDNIYKVYENPTQPPVSYVNVNHPNICIQNTYYTYGDKHQIGFQPTTGPINPLNQGQMRTMGGMGQNMFNNQPNYNMYNNNQGLNQPIQNGLSLQEQLKNLSQPNISQNNGVNLSQFSSTPNLGYNYTNTRPNNNVSYAHPHAQPNYGIDLFTPNPTSFNSSTSQGFKLNMEQPKATKKSDDPFKNLVSFK